MYRDGRMQGVHTMYSEGSHSDAPIEPQNFAFTKDEILMQFTGLKDKNGKEVYEGDVLKMFSGSISAVSFSDGGFKYKPEHHDKRPLNKTIANHAEIIGNIYENPQLIKS